MLKNKLDTGKYTIAPLSLYLSKGKFKLEIGLAKGKKDFERRKDAKNQAIARDRAREDKASY